MNDIKQIIESIDWQSLSGSMHDKGYALVPGLLPDVDCQELLENYDKPESYRKTVVMERYRFGLGEYKYFNYPLPDLVQTIRESVYPHIAPIANIWMKVLNTDSQFPETLQELQALCHKNNQTKPTVLILKYGTGGYNTLHQDLYGDIYFPMQLVLFLNEPGEDYTGGEFVLTEQTPRAQSKAIVLKPGKGACCFSRPTFAL